MPKVRPIRERVKVTGPFLVQKPKRGRRPAHWKSPSAGRLVTVTLTEAHSRNGMRYGPGEVRVREALARDFQNAEDRIAESRRRFLEPQDHIINISYASNGAMVVTPQVVPPGYFEDGLDATDVWKGHAAPAFHLRGPGR